MYLFKNKLKFFGKVRNIFTILAATIIGVLLFEIFLFSIRHGDLFSNYKYSALFAGLDFDSRSRYEYYENMLLENNSAVLAVTPSYYLSNDDFFPLSGIGDRQTLHDNENGYYVEFMADENGFRNPNRKFKKHYDAVIVGDSYTNGCCVEYQDSIAGLLRDNSEFTDVLTLGYDGNGALIEFAAIKEYLGNISFDNLFHIYYDQNDIEAIEWEKNNRILMKYYNDPKFKQNLSLNKKEVLKIKLEKHQEIIESYKTDNKFTLDQLKKIIKISRTRSLISAATNSFRAFKVVEFKKENVEIFFSIIKKIKQFTNKKNANLYFIYIPEYTSIMYPGNVPDNHYNRKEVINFLQDENIDYIDLTNHVKNYKDTSELYPYGKYGHYNEKGYRFIVDKIIKEFKLN